ncbi:LOW QUALITY PROTEIN: hypothetical protein QTO34_009766 [Cnephaeus nilssonii]|uniref:C2H2-type domain-containing protein n=1 Tax=Cnephaeus nilssonii TaxID=3371016 RepID=A0AA40HEA1_CNENI|nr:LOW QUALITY PROTEIN: hypothetical protein QTO34_009766 [Eptesicus nilssonii]
MEKRSPMYLLSVGRSSLMVHTLFNTEEFTLERNPMCMDCGKFLSGDSPDCASTNAFWRNPTCCGKTSIDSTYLIRHPRSHTGQKPCGCYQCQKLFKDITRLTQLQRTHTGETPYECSQDGKVFRETVPLGDISRAELAHLGFSEYDNFSASLYLLLSLCLNLRAMPRHPLVYRVAMVSIVTQARRDW